MYLFNTRLGFSLLLFCFVKQALVIQDLPQTHFALNSCLSHLSFPMLGLHVCVSMHCYTKCNFVIIIVAVTVLGIKATVFPMLGEPSSTALHSQIHKLSILKYSLAMNVGPTGREAKHFCAVYAQHNAWHTLKVNHCLFKGTTRCSLILVVLKGNFPRPTEFSSICLCVKS